MLSHEDHFVDKKPHSADYFGDERDFWWNQDYIELVSRRLSFDKYRQALDVGCGLGHWGRVLSPFFNDNVVITGVDREDSWIKSAREASHLIGSSHRFKYLRGDVMKLPFDDHSFDFVTCQTLLIHLKDPIEGLREMKRVLRPNGLLFVSEPNNTANAAVSNTILNRLSIDERMLRIKNDLRVQKGKEFLGEGFNSLGDLVPGYMKQLGFKNIKVSIGDKATCFIPPYDTEGEVAYIKTKKEWAKRKFVGWPKEDLYRYYIAGGGSDFEFDEYVKMCLKDQQDELEAIEKGTFHTAGGNMGYLISGFNF